MLQTYIAAQPPCLIGPFPASYIHCNVQVVPSQLGIETEAVKEAVERIKNPVVSQALWA